MCKTGVALRSRCCWLRVFGVSARCGMRKPNTRAAVKPRPVHLGETGLVRAASYLQPGEPSADGRELHRRADGRSRIG
jgi:hypothetical protein